MSFEPSKSQFLSSAVRSMQQARSTWLDAFASLEIEILRCAARAGADEEPLTAPLSQRLKSLERIPASPRLSKEHLAELRTLIAECKNLLRLRAKIVHSRMIVVELEGAPLALFQNAIDVAREIPIYAALSAPDFQKAIRRVGKITQRLEKIALTPSSPPQPKPAAAAGP